LQPLLKKFEQLSDCVVTNMNLATKTRRLKRKNFVFYTSCLWAFVVKIVFLRSNKKQFIIVKELILILGTLQSGCTIELW